MFDVRSNKIFPALDIITSLPNPRVRRAVPRIRKDIASVAEREASRRFFIPCSPCDGVAVVVVVQNYFPSSTIRRFLTTSRIFLRRRWRFPARQQQPRLPLPFGQRTFDSAEHFCLLSRFQNSMMLIARPAVPYTNSESGARMTRPAFGLCCATLHHLKCRHRMPFDFTEKVAIGHLGTVSHDR